MDYVGQGSICHRRERAGHCAKDCGSPKGKDNGESGKGKEKEQSSVFLARLITKMNAAVSWVEDLKNITRVRLGEHRR